MSCDIREYRSLDLGRGNARMTVTAFVAGNSGVQFSIGNSYCALNEDAVKDLIETLKYRIMLREGYTATGEERGGILYD